MHVFVFKCVCACVHMCLWVSVRAHVRVCLCVCSTSFQSPPQYYLAADIFMIISSCSLLSSNILKFPSAALISHYIKELTWAVLQVPQQKARDVPGVAIPPDPSQVSLLVWILSEVLILFLGWGRLLNQFISKSPSSILAVDWIINIWKRRFLL